MALRGVCSNHLDCTSLLIVLGTVSGVFHTGVVYILPVPLRQVTEVHPDLDTWLLHINSLSNTSLHKPRFATGVGTFRFIDTFRTVVKQWNSFF